ncbi:MAG: polysaccharide deacetylase family protein [Bacteroidales bacterium]|nr:polysaccharide deacetylase family protein [Bacteroidales bacterium]
MILMYHNIDDEIGFNTISTENFEEQIKYLKSRTKLSIVSINDYLKNIKHQKNKKIVTISFDDAYVSIKSKVLPIIKKYNIPIIVFVPVGLVGKHNTWDTVNGHKQINILNWNEIRELNNENLITFGTHGLNHISLGNADLETVKNEFEKSKEILEAEIGKAVECFSYPFGQLKDIPKKSHILLKEYGYKAGFSTIWNRTNKIKNQYLLNRIEIKSTNNIESFKSIIHRKIDFKYYKQQLKNLLFKLNILK